MRLVFVCFEHLQLSSSWRPLTSSATGSFDSSWDDLGPYLLSIKVDGSQLPDQLPPSWGQAWPNVQAILICSAGLRSTLPPEWGVQGAFASLVTLKLWANPRLRGALLPHRVHQALCLARRVAGLHCL